MASFEKAFAEVVLREGGWSHDALDRGGETYMGIARRHHPSWSGWKRIDAAKSSADFPTNLARDRYLPRMVRRFYRREYWEKLQGDALPSGPLGIELLDTAVNTGLKRAVAFLQESLNLLNRDGKDYPDIPVDGLLGPVTLRALQAHLGKNPDGSHLLGLMNVLQGAHYVELMRRDPSQERFARGWLSRSRPG